MVHPILREIDDALCRFGEVRPSLRTKLTGAVAAEVVREHLMRDGLPVSPRDVFIRGVTSELDLVLPSVDAKPDCNLVYDPQDVRAVLEIKYSGVYNRQVIPRLRECFDSITSRCPGVFCACVVVHERKGFRFAANSAELGYPVYTLHWWSGARANARDTGEWTKLVNDLKPRVLPAGLTSP